MKKFTLTFITLIAYFVFGSTSLQAREIYAPDGTGRAVSTIENQLGHQGAYHDEAGLVYKRARYYSENQGRFINRDPLGYIDGGNTYAYVNNRALDWVDPLGLSGVRSWDQDDSKNPWLVWNWGMQKLDFDMVVDSRLTPKDYCKNLNGRNYAFIYKIKWKLRHRSGNGGYIVQKVSISFDVKNCDTHEPDTHPSDTGKYPYWEAWRVNHKKTEVFGSQNYDDKFQHPKANKCTYGSFTITGEARYYDNMAKLPKDFKNNNSDTHAGSLPSTRTDPSPNLSNTYTPTVKRVVVVKFNCCTDKKGMK